MVAWGFTTGVTRSGTLALLLGTGAAALLAAGGCSGVIGEPTGRGDGPASGAPGDGAGASGAGGSSGPGVDPLAVTCTPGKRALGPAPMRRLSRVEYRNTVRDLFAGATLPDVTLPPDKAVGSFENNAEVQAPSDGQIDAYAAAAAALAPAAMAAVTKLAPCAASGGAGCAATLADTIGARAFRRPLDDGEKTRAVAFVEAQAAKYDFATAARMYVEALLQSPQFLYRPELGKGGASGDVPLSGYEVATRLSYFFWQTSPDDALRGAAAGGELQTPAGVEKQARRLLDDPRARVAVADFHRQWLGFDKLATISRDAALFPTFGPATPAAIRRSTERFVDHVFWETDGTVATLLTSRAAFVDDETAPLWGMAKPGGADLVKMDAKTGERAGLLTQVGIMAALAHEKVDAPILRGAFVLDRVLCAPPPPPPKGVPDIAPASPGDKPMTTRQRVAETHTNKAACQGCHERIDGVGFGFEHYDATGAYRTQENGITVDSSAVIKGLGDADGSFADAVALSEKLASSKRVETCVATHWLRFGFGRTETTDEVCLAQDLITTARTKGGSLRELLVALAVSDAFRSRPGFEPGGAP